MGYDLILKSHPSAASARHLAATIQVEMVQHPIIGPLCEVTPCQAGPTAVDTAIVNQCLVDGEFTLEQFEESCGRHDMAINKSNESSAAAFLDSLWGAWLVVLKLPPSEDEVRHAYSAVVQYATRRGFRIHDPQSGNDIDLVHPGDLPPFWK